MSFYIVLAVNSITFGGLLFLLSSGFSLIFGLMRIPNLTHGSLFMIGAYVGASFVLGLLAAKLNFWVAAAIATLAVAIIGALIERLLLRQLPGNELAQVLVTLGLSFIAADFCLMVWGGDPLTVPTPEGLLGFARLGPVVFALYRLAIIAIAVVVAIGLWVLIERTKLGAIVRAGVDDRVMAASLGINVDRAFFAVFCLGCALAGLAGVAAAPVLQIYPGMDMAILVPTLIVVVVGGPGSLAGAFLGALLVGMVETFGAVFAPQLAAFAVYAAMALVLLLRPGGLVPARRLG